MASRRQEPSDKEALYIFGKNPVHQVMSDYPDRVDRLYVLDKVQGDKRVQAILELAKQRGTPFQVTPKQRLDEILAQQEQRDRRALENLETDQPKKGGESPPHPPQDGPRNHQGIVARTTPIPWLSLPEFLDGRGLNRVPHETPWKEGKPCLFIALDEVTDPQNLGAILRVADGVGAQGVILPKNRTAPLTASAIKASSGAAFTVPLIRVTNLVDSLNVLKKSNFWIGGTDLNKTSQPYYRGKFDMPTVLVMGSEGKGLRPRVSQHCDYHIHIPMAGKVESLNVASATAVIGFEILRQQQTVSV